MNYSDMLKAARGANLWFPWINDDDDCLYWTVGHINVDNPIIKSALAKSMQRYGVVDSYGDGMQAIESKDAIVYERYIGHLDGETDVDDLVFCDENGQTEYDGRIDEDRPTKITLVKVDLNGI